MKIFRTLFGAAAAMLLSISLAAPANAADTAEVRFNAAGDQWTCYKRTGGTYPEDGHFYYCGNPSTPSVPGVSFEGNYNNHRTGYITRFRSIETTAPYTTNAMSAQGVEIYVYCTIREWEIFENFNYTGGNRRGIASYYDFVNKRVNIFQYLTSAGQDCDTPTGTGAGNKVKIWDESWNFMGHEIGHFVDDHLNVPAGQIKHSINDNSKLFKKYLNKDLDYINSTTRPNAFVPCSNIFTNTARDVFDHDVGGVTQTDPVCIGGVTLNPALPSPLNNFGIMSELIEMGYYFDLANEQDAAIPPNTWTTHRELFSEIFPWVVGTSGFSSPRVQHYIAGTYFLCAKLYVEKIAKTGNPPTPGDLTGDASRCILP